MRKILWLLILSTLAVAGCAEHRYVDKHKQGDSPIPYDIKVGDNVVVVLLDDQYHEFQVTEISDSEIAGKDIRIRYDDIALVKKKEIDSVETVKTVLAGTGTAFLVILTIILGLAVAA